MFDLIVMGDTAFDVNTFPGRDSGKDRVVTNIGGAAYYSILPASLFSKNIGIVSRVGHDFPIEKLDGLGIDLTGLKVIGSAKTTKFIHTYLSEDGQDRTFRAERGKECTIQPSDIPERYLDSRYIHIATSPPDVQMQLIKYLRGKSKAAISIDTHEAFLSSDFGGVLKAFNMADITFIDQKEKELIAGCTSKTRIIKKGKYGATFVEGDESYDVPATPRKVVDKTGAGDVLAAVFLVLRAKGESVPNSLKKAVEVASKSVEAYGVEFLRDSYKSTSSPRALSRAR